MMFVVRRRGARDFNLLAAGQHRRLRAEHGYAMAGLLVAISIMAVFLSMALPVWNTAARREREAELVFRGEQYARAIALFQRKYANTLPPDLEILVNERFLRKKYTDPITKGEFQLLSGSSGQGGATGTGATQGRAGGTGTAGAGVGRGSTGRAGFSSTTSFAQGGSGLGNPANAGGIVGVTSKSTEKSLRLYNGRGVYNEWVFVPVQRVTQAGGAPGSQTPDGASGRGTAAPGTGLGRGRGNSPDASRRRGIGGFTPPEAPGTGLTPPGFPGTRSRGQAF